MKQSSLDLNLSTKKTRKQEPLAQMDRVVPCCTGRAHCALLPRRQERPPTLELEAMLRIHCMQQWFTLSDSGDGRSLL